VKINGRPICSTTTRSTAAIFLLFCINSGSSSHRKSVFIETDLLSEKNKPNRTARR